MFDNDFKQLLAEASAIDTNGGLASLKIEADRTASSGNVAPVLTALLINNPMELSGAY
ncbi:MAG: hypothetical protein OSB10_11545 [Planctomycetota bacterium]|nr:hypothetical protein [Planctomycetota bacterium]